MLKFKCKIEFTVLFTLVFIKFDILLNNYVTVFDGELKKKRTHTHKNQITYE